MADKKICYKLDDIGFVGTQGKRSATHKADAKKTAAIIRTKKSAKVFSIPHSITNKAAK
jgi:hypothetical protein